MAGGPRRGSYNQVFAVEIRHELGQGGSCPRRQDTVHSPPALLPWEGPPPPSQQQPRTVVRKQQVTARHPPQSAIVQPSHPMSKFQTPQEKS